MKDWIASTWKILVLALVLSLSGCSTVSVGYIQILGEAQDVIARLERATEMISQDSRFTPNDYSTPHPKWVKEAAFSYDPSPGPRQHKKYSILVQANTNTGDLVIFFCEFSGSEMSSFGVRTFDALATRAQASFGKENVISGMDDEKLHELYALFEHP